MAKISRVNFSLFVINHGFVHCHAFGHRLASVEPCRSVRLMSVRVLCRSLQLGGRAGGVASLQYLSLAVGYQSITPRPV